MTTEQNHLDPIEDAIAELNAAERAGVFNRSPIEAHELLAADRVPDWARSPRALLRLWPVAAVVGLAAVVWSWMFYAEITDLRQRSMLLANASRSHAAEEYAPFNTCFRGPRGQSVGGDCRPHDLDTDGDVDLADFRNFQLAYADPGQ